MSRKDQKQLKKNLILSLICTENAFVLLESQLLITQIYVALNLKASSL